MTGTDAAAPAGPSDNPPSRKGSAEQLAETAVAVTPAIDALSTAVRDLGGTLCVAVEVGGHLFTRRSLHSRFAVTLREPDDGAAVEQEIAPAGTVNALVGAFHALRSYQLGNAASALAMDMADRLKVLLIRAGEDVPDVDERPRLPIRTVGDLIANLRTFDAELPVFGAYFVEIAGMRQSRARTLSISYERVAGSRITSSDRDVPYSLVVWSALDPTAVDLRRRDITAPPQQRPELDP